MNTLIYNNGIAIAQIDGKQLENSQKPELSFEYDGLQFHENSKFYELDGTIHQLSSDQIKEVEEFILNVTPNKQLSDQLNKNIGAKTYLASTDWYIARFYETGIEIPQDIKNKRTEARKIITDLSEFIGV